MSFSSKICTISTSGAALAGAAIFLQGCSHNYHCKQYKDKASCAKDDECAWAAVCWEKKWVHCDAKQQDECDAISICAWDQDGKTCKNVTSDNGDQGRNGASDDVLIVHPIPPPHEVPAASGSQGHSGGVPVPKCSQFAHCKSCIETTDLHECTVCEDGYHFAVDGVGCVKDQG